MKVTDKSLRIQHPRDKEINSKNFPMYRRAGNRPDTNKIKRLYDDGYDVFQISHVMRIRPEGVKMAMPKKMGKPRNNAG
jgi:hypothetical protein